MLRLPFRTTCGGLRLLRSNPLHQASLLHQKSPLHHHRVRSDSWLTGKRPFTGQSRRGSTIGKDQTRLSTDVPDRDHSSQVLAEALLHRPAARPPQAPLASITKLVLRSRPARPPPRATILHQPGTRQMAYLTTILRHRNSTIT